MSRIETPSTRMAPRLAAKTPAPDVASELDKLQGKVTKVESIVKKVPVRLGAGAPVDDQYNAHVFFSEAFGDGAGKTWSEPLEIEDRTTYADKDFFWRLEIDQLRVNPLLQGFATQWELLTAGWSFVDGYGTTIYDEAISNPLKIVRVIHSPASITVRPRFRVVIIAEYKP